MKNKKLLAVLVISALGTMSAAAAPGVSVNSTTYGNNTTASDSGTAFGSNDKASGNQSVAIGIGNESAGSDSIAIGDGAVAGNPKDPDDQVGEQDYANAIAIGAQSKAQAKFTTAVGGFSQATKQDASAFGQQAYAWGEESTATGTMSQAYGRFSTVDGAYAHAEADNSSAFGGYAYATKARATALGTSSQATENNSTAVGAFSKASSNGGVAVGAFSNANRNAGTAAYLTNEKSTLGAVSVGDNTKGYTRQITGVAGGSEDTDAVNVAQLKQVYAVANQNIGDISNTVTNIDNRVNDLGNKVDNLDNRMDRVGASAAALAALHPLDFDPDAKWDFAAGYGNYKGANAAAIGAFYRPNEDTMFSVGGSFSGGENMVNAGLSLKIGQGNHVSTSRVAMAKKIVDQDKRIQALTDQVAQLTAHLNAFMGTGVSGATTDFPDVPKNHWAYEYVTKLAGSGVLEGYEDGNFKGDRTMTRYEMAAIIYRAMQRGVAVDQKALTEFQPELERIRVDTIRKDKNGNPTIERVRVVK